jgi:histidinol-phosphate aminotransferase
VIDERDRLVPKLRELGFEVVPSESNFILATAPTPGAETIYKGLKQRNILIRWWSTPGLSDRVRITVGTPEQNAKLLQTIQAIIAADK